MIIPDWERIKDDRKSRLFAVACVREVWHLLTDERSRNAVEVSERFVDGLVSEQELKIAYDASLSFLASFNKLPPPANFGEWLAARGAMSAAHQDSRCAALDTPNYSARSAAISVGWPAEYNAATRKQQLFLNDITNEPNIHISPDSLAWNNQTLTKLATEIYKNKNFGNMPILADALQDANAPTEFVQHCYNAVHIKGCWLLDKLMGK